MKLKSCLSQGRVPDLESDDARDRGALTLPTGLVALDVVLELETSGTGGTSSTVLLNFSIRSLNDGCRDRFCLGSDLEPSLTVLFEALETERYCVEGTAPGGVVSDCAGTTGFGYVATLMPPWNEIEDRICWLKKSSCCCSDDSKRCL